MFVRRIRLADARRLDLSRVLPTLKMSMPQFRSLSTTAYTQAKQGHKSFGERVKSGSKLLISSAIVLAALGVTTVSLYLVFKELFSPSGQTPTFNRVVNLIQKDEKALKLLGYSEEEIKKGKIKLKAYGDVPQDRWTRDRPIRATQYTAKDGSERLIMRFFVESKYSVGVVRVEAVEQNVVAQKFNYVTLDVKGYPRYYLIGAAPHTSSFMHPMSLFGSNGTGFLGVKWGAKKSDDKTGNSQSQNGKKED